MGPCTAATVPCAALCGTHLDVTSSNDVPCLTIFGGAGLAVLGLLPGVLEGGREGEGGGGRGRERKGKGGGERESEGEKGRGRGRKGEGGRERGRKVEGGRERERGGEKGRGRERGRKGEKGGERVRKGGKEKREDGCIRMYCVGVLGTLFTHARPVGGGGGEGDWFAVM